MIPIPPGRSIDERAIRSESGHRVRKNQPTDPERREPTRAADRTHTLGA